MACLAMLVPAHASDAAHARIIAREIVADPGYSEGTVTARSGAFAAYRVRTWAPTPEAGAAAVDRVVILDGQADAGLVAAMVRQAAAIAPERDLEVVTVSPADDPLAPVSRRRPWSPAEQASLADFVVEHFGTRGPSHRGGGQTRLVGPGRGGGAVLIAFARNPRAFDRFHARFLQADPGALSALADRPGDEASLGRGITLGLSWTFDGVDREAPEATAFLRAAEARGGRIEWFDNESDEDFLQRVLWR